MPARNALKQYLENGYYHLYNRGIDKQLIFRDQQDYSVFLGYLKQYLIPKNEVYLRNKLSEPAISSIEKDKILKLLRLNNFNGELSLLAYCLMPNHFHFLIKQVFANTIDRFLRSLGSRYSQYFNHKYKRIGPLYQGVYKAVLVNTEPQLLHLTRYIHKQALAFQGESLEAIEQQPCSYFEYLGKRKTEWVKSKDVLSYFSEKHHLTSYQSFIKESDNFEDILKLAIDF